MTVLTLNVNGADYTVDVPDEDTPLLWVLRDTLGLTGTKFGCGEGDCGACNVHLDGEVVQSCQTRIGDVGAAAVVTIEGLARAGEHPLVQAWLAEHVSQCGYCQPGQIMSAAALLARSPNPSDDDIDAALEYNLCRCGTYQRIRRAIHRAVAEGGVS